MDLVTVWFLAIAFLWLGYLILEGFDFGVGMLLGVLGRDDRERRVVINTIGPVWDANEVWVIVAVGAMFAAFPDWYASLISGSYLVILTILVGLIIRAVAFEYRGKRTDPAWRRRWDRCIMIGSAIPAFGWGAILANLTAGLPIDSQGVFVGGVLDLFQPYAVLGGLTTVGLFLTHGAIFIALKTDGDIRYRARQLAERVGVGAVILIAVFGVWSCWRSQNLANWVLLAASILALSLALVANRRGREGWAFLGTLAAVACLVSGYFVDLYPALIPSTLNPAWGLTIWNASSTPYTLTILTWGAAIALPLVIAYQGWTYWVFRKRLRVESIPPDPKPQVQVG